MSRPSKTSRVPCRSAITVSRRSSSVSTVELVEPAQLGQLAVEDRAPAADEALAGAASDRVGVERGELGRLGAVDRLPEGQLALLRVELCVRFVDPAAHVDADGDVQRVGAGRQRLVEPAARQVHRVAGAQRHVEHRLAGRAERRAGSAGSSAAAPARARRRASASRPPPAARSPRACRDGREALASRAACSRRSPARGGRGTPPAAGSSGRAAASCGAGPGRRSSRPPRTRRARGARRRRR